MALRDDTLLALPGADLVDRGLRDAAAGRVSVESLLVAIGRPRLEQLGVSVPPAVREPEARLYAMLAADDPDRAHGRYNALVHRLVSFERALACAGR